MRTGLPFSIVRYVPLGVSSPGRPVLIGQCRSSLPSLYSHMWCLAVLATTMSDLPMLNSWVSVWSP